MLVVMNATASPEQVGAVCRVIEELGLTPHPMPGAQRTAIGITGNKGLVDPQKLETMSGVVKLIHVTEPYKLVGREFHPDDSTIDVDGVAIGGPALVVMAGPCSVESRDQLFATAAHVAKLGIPILRGGAFKPRTSPYSFQGLGEQGLKFLAEARDEFGLKVVTEAVDNESLDLVVRYADMVQVGARNMQNYSLLKRIGQCDKPVLLKRGMSATLEELLMSAEYIVSEGNTNVVLCERGVRTFADHTRNTLDLSAVPFIKRVSHLPIITDPSHGTGRRDKVGPLSYASIAVGADGLIVEVHYDPDSALSDGAQSLYPEQMREIIERARMIVPAVGRTLWSTEN